MKKHLIAAAVAAAVAVPAVAQVTVSGTLDTSYQSLKNNGADSQSQSVVNSNLRSSSNLTISGSEDLGNGLKAQFFLQESLNTDTGVKSTAFDRGAFVGVSGGFGTVNLGTPNNTFLGAMGTFNNFGGNINALATGDGRTASQSLATGAALTSRPQNSVQYISPTFNGVSANIVMSQGAEGTTTLTKKTGEQMQFNLTGKVGALSFIVGVAEQDTVGAEVTGVDGFVSISNSTVAALFTQAAATGALTHLPGSGTIPITGVNATVTLITRVAPVAATTGKLRNQGLGISYDFGMMQVTYNRMDGKETRSDVTGERYKFLSQSINAQVPMGAYSLFASLREFEKKTAAAANLDHRGLTAGVTYTLSKRTNVYAVYDRVKNDSASQAVTRGGAAAVAGDDPSQIAVGLRHSF